MSPAHIAATNAVVVLAGVDSSASAALTSDPVSASGPGFQPTHDPSNGLRSMHPAKHIP